MPFFVVCTTRRHDEEDREEVRLVAGCSSSGDAEALAATEAHGHALAARDPDTGAWWAADGGELHSIDVTDRWPPSPR